MRQRPKSSAIELVDSGDLVPDQRLATPEQDLLEHRSIARAVAEIAIKAEAPVNIALFGPWGSGKSSVYAMIESHIKDLRGDTVRISRYDAWKYGGHELKRNFIDSISNDLDVGDLDDFDTGLHQDQVTTKLKLWDWFKGNLRSLAFGIVLAVAVAGLWVVLQASASSLTSDADFGDRVDRLLPQAGTVFGLALVAVLLGPKVLEGAVTTLKTSPPAGADQFAKRFDELVKTAVKPSRGQRLVVFIDELDRCAPGDVVSTLIDLKTFLDHPSCAFIVAADREVLETALRQVPQAKPVREAEPYYATPGAFLDKIFQYQIALPPLRARALTRFAQDVLAPQGGLWEDLRTKSVDEYERVVFALVPIHVRSPRRVKVLLNNFAATVRVAEGRSIPWTERASELAVLTVLQTEFPSVAAELTKVPRLLSYLRGVEEPRDKEATEAFERFAPRSSDSAPSPTHADDTTTVDTPAGTLLAESASTSLDAADDLLRRQLANYLSKIAAAGIEDPRPDLMYLQGAAGSSDLGDSRLGDVIDFAADTAPDDVVEQFASASSHTLAMAVPLLVAEGETASRPGQTLAYESACRLIERIDPTEQAAVARRVSPAVLAAASAQRLSRDSAPGALLVAACVGADDIVATILDELRNEDLPPALLTRVAPVAARLDGSNLGTFADILIDRYELEPEPLVALLRAVSIQRATELWPGIAARVLTIIDRLETPPAAAPTPARQVAASPSGPTGLGLQRLDQLIDAAKSRPDGEPLVGAIYEPFSSPTTQRKRPGRSSTSMHTSQRWTRRSFEPGTRSSAS